MKIAVTGASGFIGRHVLHELAGHGVEVVAVIRPWTTEPPALFCDSVVCLDIYNAPENAFELMGRPDTLIHLAWGGLPNYRSLHHIELELPVQYRFLKTLVFSGLKNLMVAGTCFEYGMQSGPLSEEVEPRPSNPYGFAKDVLRRQLEYLKAEHPYALIWPRLFYLFGEGQAETSLYSQLRKAVERGDTTFHMTGGEQLRDYLPVTEVARIIVALAMMQEDLGVINICSGRPVSVRGLVEGWIRGNSWTIDLNLGYYGYPDYEPMAFWGDRRKLQALLEAV